MPPRNERHRCSNCQHWHSSFDGADTGECRIGPPEADHGFPRVDSDEWCSLGFEDVDQDQEPDEWQDIGGEG